MTAEQNNFSSEDSPEIRYAGFWIRVVASIIDSVLFIVPGYLVTLVVAPGMLQNNIILVLFVIYNGFFYSSAWQATIGKKLLGMKVVDENGDKISFLRGVGRTVSQFFSFIILFIGFFMVGWNKKKRGLHDMIAGTYVIKS